METIERYIQFAITDWKFNDYDWYDFQWYEETHIEWENYIRLFFSVNDEIINQDIKWSIIDLITSKDYIESIARGLLKTDYVNTQSAHRVDEDILTTSQAIAIRDWELPNFINNIFPK